jgi:glyoxylase-like metal-dependent hydrolase (beta-lactamase superfamily II)
MGFEGAAAVVERWSRGEVQIPPPALPILRTLAGTREEDPRDVARGVAATNALEQRAPRIEFTPGVWMLPVKTATLPPATHTNVWMPGGRRFAVVDPGSTEPDERARLLEVVARRREHGGAPHAVLLTHHHRDHSGGAAAIAEALGVPLRAHAHALERIETGGRCRAEPLAGGEEIDLGGVTLRAIETPGHAPGHLAFEIRESRLLVAGDLVSGLSTILIDPEDGDMDAYLESLARVRALEPRLLLPGHGPPLPGAHLTRMIEHREEREARILALLGGEPRALAGIAGAAYADVPEMPAALTAGQTLSHLRRLARHGRARQSGGGGWSRR